MGVVLVGTDGSREFFLLTIDDLADWPIKLPFEPRRFSLFLVMDGRDVAANSFSAWHTFTERAIGQGLAALSTWGPECERIHDIMDEDLVYRDVVEGRGEAFLSTTWHSGDTLTEALEFFRDCAVDSDLQDEDAPGLICLVGREDLRTPVEQFFR